MTPRSPPPLIGQKLMSVPRTSGLASDLRSLPQSVKDAQTRPVWDCQDGLPRNGPGVVDWGSMYIWQSQTGRVWDVQTNPTISPDVTLTHIASPGRLVRAQLTGDTVLQRIVPHALLQGIPTNGVAALDMVPHSFSPHWT